jgi:hypothetical protein
MRLVAEVFPRTVVVDGGLVVADGPTASILADEPLLEAHGLEAPWHAAAGAFPPRSGASSPP